jgi:hypothetical protein
MINRILLIYFLSLFPLLAQEVQFLTSRVVDLGRILEGNVATGSVRFVNRGKEPLKIKRIQPTCGCTLAKIDKKEYASGDTATISFTLHTEGYRGLIRKSLNIFFEGNAIPNKSIKIQANIYSELEVEPRYLHFPMIHLNPDTLITDYIKIQNRSNHPITLQKVYADYDQMRVKPASLSIPPNKDLSIYIELKPLRKERKRFCIYIETDYEPKSVISIPVYVDIQD